MTGRKHILLPDNEAAFRFSAGLALRIAGYRVSEAQDGLDALDGLVRFKDQGTPVVLLVTDLRMPNLDGAELLDALNGHEIPVPVFVVSGCFDPEALRELSLAGCVEHMEKPFQPSECILAQALEARWRYSGLARHGLPLPGGILYYRMMSKPLPNPS